MQANLSTQCASRPLIIGEVLYDSFPDGSRVLGGAPFNVAWHLQGFGLAPIFVSRIGDDALGEQILAAMNDWGMESVGVQRDDDHPTGRVIVSFVNQEPRFDIVTSQAYDFIDSDQLRELINGQAINLIYHGSLIARHEVSRSAIEYLHTLEWPLYIDVNLRTPWWSESWLHRALHKARWVKLNDHELRTLANFARQDPDLHAQAHNSLKKYNLELLVVTRGSAGATLYSVAAPIAVSPPAIGEIVDTVGAGDAFSAVTILGLVRRWTLPVIAERAVEFAAAICQIRGGTTTDRSMYERYLRKWEL